MNRKKKVLIIGGGASGIIAGITAARNGAEVIIIEQLQRVGKKLLATGNGRCNLTNLEAALNSYHGERVDFAKAALEKFNVSKTIEFFEDLGISCRTEGEGKVYPYSGQASSVIDVLRYELQKLNVEEKCDVEVKKIALRKKEFELMLKDGSRITGDRVILATGGKANANLGSTGMGYKMATELGHTLVDPFPALVQLRLDFQYLKALAGVKFIGKASVIAENKEIRTEYGEILFTDYGISGPPILQLSRCVGEKLNIGIKTTLSIDMFPEYSVDEVFTIIKRKTSNDSSKPLDFAFIGLLNKKLIPIVLKACGFIDIHRACGEISEGELRGISRLLKNWEFNIIGTNPWRDAQVTAGGIATTGIDPETMESKIIKGLYMCGEVVDIDGDCGGFNLQWAWSSGYLAGLNASRT